MKNSLKLASVFVLLTAALIVPAKAAPLTWTGLSAVTNLWSDPNNWSPAQAPTASDSVLFLTDSGFTNVQGAVNNVVDASVTVSNLSYSTISNFFTATPEFQTTMINDGATLTVDSVNLTNGTNQTIFFVGTNNSGAQDLIYETFTGGGTLAVGNLASPDTNKDFEVSNRAATANSGAHKAMLDLSGLNKFTFGGGRFQISANGISSALPGFGAYVGYDRAWGSILLAKTNVITCARPRTVQFPYANLPFAAGVDTYANASGNLVLVELGQENTINAEGIIVGGARHASGATMKFRTGLTSPTLKLRGADGVSRVAELAIGDNSFPNASAQTGLGTMDLSLGVADILVDTMNVGRNNSGLSGVATTGPGTGTLTLAAGACDVTTLSIGCQDFNNAGIATGTVNVRSTAILTAGKINIGRDAGSGTGRGVGTLAITLGGTVRVAGDLLEISDPAGNGVSTLTLATGGILDMMPAGDTVPGNITVDKLNYALCTLTNYDTLSLSNLAVTVVSEFPLYPGQTLAPIAKGVVGTLPVVGNLSLYGGTLAFDLSSPGSSDLITVSGALALNATNTVDVSGISGAITPGTYTLLTYGTLVGGTNNLQVTSAMAGSRYTTSFDTSTAPNVSFNISGTPFSLIWSGDGTANVWDLKTSTNWNTQVVTFYDLDTVTFDDTGSTSPAVNLTGTLQPGGALTVSSTNDYTFAGSGKISGSAGLAKSGTGKLTLATVNNYTGATTINGGTVLVNGGLGNTAVTVASGGTLGGTGTILGPVTVQSGGTLAPGVGIGALAIANTLTLSDGSTNVFQANLSTPANDQVTGMSKVTYGGTLSMVLSGRSVVASDTFKLFTATTYAGAFTGILPATPGSGLSWNTSTLATDGTLRVVSQVNTASTNISAQVTGNQLNLVWPFDHIGWRLQSQTNTLSTGIGTNWFDVAGSTTTNQVTIPINPAAGAVFYRMIYP